MSFNKLPDILLQNLNIHILQITLSPNEIAYLKRTINERPSIFIKISTNINKIIYDNRLDYLYTKIEYKIIVYINLDTNLEKMCIWNLEYPPDIDIDKELIILSN